MVIRDFTDCSVPTVGKVLNPGSILFCSGPRLYFPPPHTPLPLPLFPFLPFLLCSSVSLSLFLSPSLHPSFLLFLILANKTLSIVGSTGGLPLERSLPNQHWIRHVFPGSSTGKESAYSAEDPSSIPALGRSPGEGNDYPLQFSCAFLLAQTVKNPSAGQKTWI